MIVDRKLQWLYYRFVVLELFVSRPMLQKKAHQLKLWCRERYRWSWVLVNRYCYVFNLQNIIIRCRISRLSAGKYQDCDEKRGHKNNYKN